MGQILNTLSGELTLVVKGITMDPNSESAFLEGIFDHNRYISRLLLNTDISETKNEK